MHGEKQHRFLVPMDFDWDRIFRSLPEQETRENRTGFIFVSILFGLVVSAGVALFAAELYQAMGTGDREVSEVRLAHLAVALAATILSWIGYHQSKQYPPFVIKFIDIPLWMFMLDIAMLTIYYLLVATVEGGTAEPPTPATVDAFPEALLVMGAFILYLLWDVFSFVVANDDAYLEEMENRKAGDREPFGARRQVTALSAVLAAVVALGIVAVRPSTPGTVMVADALLVTLLIAYRLAKRGYDPKAKRRGEPVLQSKPKPALPADPARGRRRQ
jgi:hypothetical protein